jgi:hypothetical protein
LAKNSVVKESLTTAADGKKYRTKYYNLDVISLSDEMKTVKRLIISILNRNKP